MTGPRRGALRLAAAACAVLGAAGCALPRVGAKAGTGESSLARQLARAVEPSDQPRYFFLGAALSDRTPAFDGDVRTLDRILGHHYGPSYRSILLSNQALLDGSRDLPLATPEHIEAAIRGLRATRRPDDRFIILLSSHGRKGALAEQQRALGGLDEAIESRRIAWWVNALAPNRTWVLISACYAGSHLDAVKGAEVLVMTASDGDHASLGCGTLDRNTYFVSAVARSLDFDQTFARLWDRSGKLLRSFEERLGYQGANPLLTFGEGVKELEQEPLTRF